MRYDLPIVATEEGTSVVSMKTLHHSVEGKPPAMLGDDVKRLRHYLLSDDTRLPLHDLFTCTPAHPQDYDSYVGEDVWNGPNVQTRHAPPEHSPSSAPAASTASDMPMHSDREGSSSEWCALPSGPAVQFLVNWMTDALSTFAGILSPSSSCGGVVLCGRFRCVSDCTWAVSSREVVLRHPRDIMVAMRMSTIFLEDLERQADALFQSCRSGDEDDGVLSFSLEAAVDVSSASIFRLFFPLHVSARAEEGAPLSGSCRDVALGGECFGSQRTTDVCFPELVCWSADDEDAALVCMRRKFTGESSTAVPATCNDVAPGSIAEAVLKYCVDHLLSSEQQRPRPILAVDIVFESSRLPLTVLSAALWSHQLNPEPPNLSTDDFFCLYRDHDTFATILDQQQQQQQHLTSVDNVDVPCQRRMFIARDASELRPMHMRSTAFQSVEALHTIDGEHEHIPDFVRALMVQQGHLS